MPVRLTSADPLRQSSSGLTESRVTSAAEKTRSITIDGQSFGWRVTHRHRESPSNLGERTCVNQFMAYRRSSSGAALRTIFAHGDGGGPDSFDHGVVRVTACSLTINLHRPGTAATLIRRALELGWSQNAPAGSLTSIRSRWPRTASFPRSSGSASVRWDAS